MEVGDADAGALGGDHAFGAADVGPAAEQVGRDAHDHLGRRRRESGRPPNSRPDRAAECPAARTGGCWPGAGRSRAARDQGPVCSGWCASGLTSIFGRAALELGLGLLDELGLDGDVVAAQLEPLLDDADLDVGRPRRRRSA